MVRLLTTTAPEPASAPTPEPAPAPAMVLVVTLIGALVLLPGDAAAQRNVVPDEVAEVGFAQRLGERVPPDVELVDATGAPVRLGDLLGRRPAILVPVYYDCPMLCTLTMNGLTTTLRTLEFDVGEEIEVIAFSFDPAEGPALAAEARAVWTARYGRPGSEAGWHFLTGDAEAVGRLTDALGFTYRYDEASGEWAHAAGLVVLTPDGRIARTFFGIEYPSRDLRLALVEAAEGEIGSLVDEVLLYCFSYDPATGRYSAAVMNLVRAGGALTVILLALAVTVMWRREKNHPRDRQPSPTASGRRGND